MKLIFTFFVLVSSFFCLAARDFTDSIPVKNKPAETRVNGFITSTGQVDIPVTFFCRKPLRNKEPLLVIDGVIAEFDQLNLLNPDEIASIDILKENTSSIISCRRNYNGIIVITTKSANTRRLIIKDFLTGQPVPGASVSFLSRSDTLRVVANDSGILVMKNLKTGVQYSVVVSSAGYKTVSAIVKGKEQEILLERDVKACQPAYAIGYVHLKRRDISCGGVVNRAICSSGKKNEIQNKDAFVYPNPVQRGNTFNLEVTASEEKILQLSVTGLDGKLVWQQSQKLSKGMNRFAVIADARWTAGMYIIQLRDNRGKVVKTEKLIIQ
ncbi:MAG: T9SS type A sorting domain-containing protein [Chitinophagaceae bacterium]|nr:T9SS type A sorting domain-containing protein [Chitinophagaceae bacterium]